MEITEELSCGIPLREKHGLVGIRTPGQSVKSRLLYLAELQAPTGVIYDWKRANGSMILKIVVTKTKSKTYPRVSRIR